MKKATPPKNGFRFTSILERSVNRLWGCHFRVPKRIVERLSGTGSRRVLCSVNGSAEHQCAILPQRGGTFVITVNKNMRDALGLDFGIEVQVTLKKDLSTYGLPLPAELQELLRQDPEGSTLFHALTQGRQRTLLYIIGLVKNPEKRTARAVAVVRHLKANGGIINYRQLNAMLIDPRR
ncbi:MAG TPA: hypothetical protein DCP63_06015 [Bacteroidetes bacterium]|nr:hypothetical protein [Bacteroidota bacterium]